MHVCEQNITPEECKLSLFSMKLNKSPGSDGLSVEFYQAFWDHLWGPFMNSLNESIRKSQLTDTQSHGVLSLIFKSGDETNLNNWRPITLLNVDYKIITRTLAQRLQKVITKIVSTDQNGYIKSRFIGFSIRQIQDIIDYAEEGNLEGVLLFLDYQKAFDSIEWNFMNLALEKFGFGHNFINSVKMLYKNANNSIINNGWVSNSFSVSRGIRQGCPISALLYILSAEIMAENIRNNMHIKGIKVRQSKELKLTQMADDTTVFLESKNCIPALLNEIQRFSEASGLILNKSKTKGILLGRNRRNNRHIIHGIDFSISAVKALGIYFSANTQESQQLNWNRLIEEIQNLLSSWKRRKLTLFGRITVLKSLAMSKCNYLLQCITVTKDILAKIESLFFKFLWNDKNDKVKRKQLTQNYEHGGIRMADVKTQLQTFQIKWVNRLISDDEMNWKVIPKFYFNKYGNNFLLFKMNFGSIKELKYIKLPSFYKNILETWINVGGGNTGEPKTFESIRNQVLWGNQFIKCNGTCLLYKNWIDVGIIYVNDIIAATGDINSAYIYEKLNMKQNWISEICRLKRAIPNHWKQILKTPNSRETTVYTQTRFIIKDEKDKTKICLDKNSLIQSKQIFTFLQNRNLHKPIMENFWAMKFKLSTSDQYWGLVYNSIMIHSKTNKLKEFRFKLINAILPCKQILFKWKLTDSTQCEVCKVTEDYEHLFINCPVVQQLWTNLDRSFKKCNFSNSMKKLEYLIIGYKPDQKQYVELNHILSTIGYSIFKGYCLSENRKKYLDLLYLAKAEFLKNMEISDSLQIKRNRLFRNFIDYFVYGRQ